MSQKSPATRTAPMPGTRQLQMVLQLAAIGALLLVVISGAGCANRPSGSPPKSASETATEPTSQPPTEPAGPPPGKAVEVMLSVVHVEPGAKHEPYNTEPPTSGPHYDESTEAGFYDEAPPDEELVHSLEHGYVIIWYRADDLDPAERTQLVADIKAVMEKGGTSSYTSTPKLIAVPRPKLKPRLALTSWGRLDELDRVDEQEILSFIEHFRDEAPEYFVP